MLGSILSDIKQAFKSGNMIVRLLIINVSIFVIMALINAFSPPSYPFGDLILRWIAIPGDLWTLMSRPWTLLTHMFVHVGFWHVFWNMIILYWIGVITGDLVGDRHILPIYIYGGLVGAVAYLIFYQLLPGSLGSMAIGASAGVMAIVVSAGVIAPDYVIRLILIGPVRLKFIVAFMVVMDIIGAGGNHNTGGHIAHLGGIAFGWFYASKLQLGDDYSLAFNHFLEKFSGVFKNRKTRSKSPLTVSYKSSSITKESKGAKRSGNLQEEVDRILDKIKVSGYDSLTEEEKETLYQASKE